MARLMSVAMTEQAVVERRKTVTRRKGWLILKPGDRLTLCRYDDEHADLEAIGWRVTDGKSGRGAGYSTNAAAGRRERLWYSPACHALTQDRLDFDGEAS